MRTDEAEVAGRKLGRTSAGMSKPSLERARADIMDFQLGYRNTQHIFISRAQMAATTWYDQHAVELTRAYEQLSPVDLHAWLVRFLPPPPALVVDVGAGSGRDGGWLAEQGYDVIAVEPSPGMRAEGQRLHRHPRLRWIDDSLPALSAVSTLGCPADVVLLNGVWQHVPPAERPRALRKLSALLRSGGILALTLRHGPDDAAREMHPVSADELEKLARACGMFVEYSESAADEMGRPSVTWTHVALRLPDDGTGALPLLRHIILEDDKSSTYKLGLLRSLCRAADAAGGLAREGADGYVELPLGVVALNWLRLYLPLIKADLPQTPNNRGPDGLGFAKEGVRKLLAGAATAADLRVGARFGPEQARAVGQALREAADTITRMPANFLRYPKGGVIFPVAKTSRLTRRNADVLDGAYLRSFGSIQVPRDLWRAMQRFSAWIEPALIMEWRRLIRLYADGQDRVLDEAAIATAMTWPEPERDVRFAREAVLTILNRGQRLECVWTGRRLTEDNFDIDHCLPWSAWPCASLFNLLPASPAVNRHLKRGLLPSAPTLIAAGEAIRGWRDQGYVAAGTTLRARFFDEADANLPTLSPVSEASPLEAVFTGLEMQRLRLSLNQQVPEWDPE